MRAVIQRVSRAQVTVGGALTGKIDRGLLVLLGITHNDAESDADYLVDKVVNLRIFDDEDGKMNLSLREIGGGLLVVSQFTLYGDTRRGRRPSFIDAAPGPAAEALYNYFVERSRQAVENVQTGAFGAMMDVELVNDGPVTIILNSERSF